MARGWPDQAKPFRMVLQTCPLLGMGAKLCRGKRGPVQRAVRLADDGSGVQPSRCGFLEKAVLGSGIWLFA